VDLVSGGGDAVIKLWDISTGNEIRTFTGHKRSVMSISISFPDGKYIASGGEDSTIKLWDISSGSLIWSIKGHAASVDEISFSHDGK